MVQLLQTRSRDNLEGDRYFLCRGLSWQQFSAIRDNFDGVAGVRLCYCQGVLEIMGIGKLHEAIRCSIGLLLGQYFIAKGIEFFPSGSYSQVVPGETEYQSDLSYCFDTDKDRPDLAIEIVVTSGRPIKLRKYELMQVREVWFWEDGAIAVYCLGERGYDRQDKSEILPDLNLDLIARCLLFSSPLEALREFQIGLD